MLAHRVHLVDSRAALEQGAGDRLLVFKRDLACRQRQKRRPAAGNEGEHEIVAREACIIVRICLAAAMPAESGFGCPASPTRMRFVGAPWPTRVTTSPLSGPRQYVSTAAARLARADDDRSPSRRLGQMVWHDQRRVGRRDRRVEQRTQQDTGIG
jgi:hypothetical protein